MSHLVGCFLEVLNDGRNMLVIPFTFPFIFVAGHLTISHDIHNLG